MADSSTNLSLIIPVITDATIVRDIYNTNWNTIDGRFSATYMAIQAKASVTITGGSITGITDLAIADGGTGASTAADARTALGLVISTNVAEAGANDDITSLTGLTTPLGAAYGGTGKANNAASTITITGAYTLGLTLSNTTALTLPTSGTLVNSAVATLSSLTSIGTITTGGLGTGAVIAGVTMTLGSDSNFDMYYRASNILTRLAPNTAASNKFLRMIGTGTAGQAPSWEALGTGDIPDISATYSVKAGNTSLITLGTVTTGTWTATTIKANYLQSAAADLGAANVEVVLSNTNGSYVTNLTTDGTITATVGFAGALTGNVTGNADTVTGFTPASGSLTLAGADALTLTTSADTNVTLPTTGTLATLAGSEVFTNKTMTLPIIKGTTASDLPTYSAEFLDADNWTSTGWTGDWATGWIHAADGTTVLSHDHAAVNTTKYQIAYTVTRSAGSFTITFGGQSIAGIIATGAWGPTSTSTGNLQITPTSTFVGSIIISIKSITAISTPIQTFQSSEGTVRTEIRANSGGINNTIIGYEAGSYLTTGLSDCFIGMEAGMYTTTGYWNTFVGTGAGYLNTIGYYNTFMGANAGMSNVSGFANVFMGVDSGRYATGYRNTFVGTSSGYNQTTGLKNTLIGCDAGLSITTGSGNVCLGTYAGEYQSDGSTSLTDPENSVYLGNETKGLNNSDSNSIVIGYQAIGIGANTVVLGNDSITKTILKGNVAIGKTNPFQKLDIYFNSAAYNPTAYNIGTIGLEGAGTTGDYNGIEFYDTGGNNESFLGVVKIGSANDDLVYQTYKGSTYGELFRITGTGNVSIGGLATPTARLHLPAGTATASTAPLKFTSGTLLNTAEAGAIEFLTDKYYATITTSAVRKTLAYVERPVVTLTKDDPTPDVSAGEIFLTVANDAACEITDLDLPSVGKVVTIVCGSSTNACTITDGGNFALSANWTPDINDVITLFVRTDNDYVEISRSAN